MRVSRWDGSSSGRSKVRTVTFVSTADGMTTRMHEAQRLASLDSGVVVLASVVSIGDVPGGYGPYFAAKVKFALHPAPAQMTRLVISSDVVFFRKTIVRATIERKVLAESRLGCEDSMPLVRSMLQDDHASDYESPAGPRDSVANANAEAGAGAAAVSTPASAAARAELFSLPSKGRGRSCACCSHWQWVIALLLLLLALVLAPLMSPLPLPLRPLLAAKQQCADARAHQAGLAGPATGAQPTLCRRLAEMEHELEDLSARLREVAEEALERPAGQLLPSPGSILPPRGWQMSASMLGGRLWQLWPQHSPVPCAGAVLSPA